MCRVVRGAVGAGCQIAAVGGQQDAPPLGEIHDPGGDEQNAQDRPCDPVGGAEEIVLHPGELSLIHIEMCIRDSDGIILAAAGLSRLGLLDDPRFSFEFLEPETFIPAGGQGIIAVEAKKGSEVLKILEKLNDREAERALFAERKVLRLLGAGCTAAVGVYAKEENGSFRMDLMRETKNGVRCV